MRTTIQLEDDLLKEARIRAAEQGVTLAQLIDEALRERLFVSRQHQKVKPFRLRSYGKGGLRPGVNPEDNCAIRDLMDEDAHYSG